MALGEPAQEMQVAFILLADPVINELRQIGINRRRQTAFVGDLRDDIAEGFFIPCRPRS